jgi:ribosomal protein S6
MALYEHIYLARQDISAQQVDALTARFKAVIESFGGKVEKVEYWGVKSLAYRIKKNRKAHHDSSGRSSGTGPIGNDAQARRRRPRRPS